MTFRFDSVVAWIEDIVSAFCLAGIVRSQREVYLGVMFTYGFLWADE